MKYDKYPIQKIEFNIQFANFIIFNSVHQQVKINFLGILMKYNQAVNLGIKSGNIKEVKFWCNRPHQDKIKKNLWLKVIINEIKNDNKDIKQLL